MAKEKDFVYYFSIFIIWYIMKLADLIDYYSMVFIVCICMLFISFKSDCNGYLS